MDEKYLPVGSVVLLKGGNRRVMIFGVQQRQAADADMVWDYLACPFPEGHINDELTFLFNHDQIERVFFLGMQDEEEMAFATAIRQRGASPAIVPSTAV
jgi:hypothetical protein